MKRRYYTDRDISPACTSFDASLSLSEIPGHVWVGNLDTRVTEDRLSNYFSRAGRNYQCCRQTRSIAMFCICIC